MRAQQGDADPVGLRAGGYRPRPGVGFSRVYPEDRKRVERGWDEAIAGTGNRWSDVFRFERPDGTHAHIVGQEFILRDTAGKAVRVISALFDVTDRRESETAVRRSEETLRLVLENVREDTIIPPPWIALSRPGTPAPRPRPPRRAKDHFLAVLSHELRTPLTPVRMLTRTLARRKDLPPEVMDALALIERNVQTAARFIDELLDLTHPGPGIGHRPGGDGGARRPAHRPRFRAGPGSHVHGATAARRVGWTRWDRRSASGLLSGRIVENCGGDQFQTSNRRSDAI